MESFAQTLRSKLEFIRSEYPTMDVSIPQVLHSSLLFTYHVIKASEPLLRVALAATPVESTLHAYFAEHLLEETNHAEWLAQDLLTAGVDVTKLPTSVEAMEMAGSQFYLVHCVHPRALLGYMAFLEFFPASMELVEKLEELHGRDLIRTLRHHAINDVAHSADLEEVIDALAEQDKQLVWDSAMQTAEYFGKAAAQFN